MVRRKKLTDDELKAVIKRLQEARQYQSVTLVMHDGRELVGALTYQDRFGDGRIINIEKEIACDYNLYDVKEVNWSVAS